MVVAELHKYGIWLPKKMTPVPFSVVFQLLFALLGYVPMLLSETLTFVKLEIEIPEVL